MTLTTFFPNSANRHRAVFLENLVRAMQSHCEIRVVSPVPYAPAIRFVPRWYALSRVGREETIDGIKVWHPRFLVVPKLNFLSGIAYFLGVFSLLRRLKQDHGSYLIHAHCAYPDGVGAALAARMLDLPYVVTAHGSDINVQATAWTLAPQIRWALNRASGVIAVSRALETKIGEMVLESAQRLECIPCAGFNPGVFFRRKEDGARTPGKVFDDLRTVVFVGELLPIKGVEFLINAWVILTKDGRIGARDRLVVIGDGKCRAALIRQVKAAGIDANVQFTGALRQVEVSHLVAAASLLCLPSHNEGMPNVIVESLACGVPVVATRVGGIPEIIREGVNGMLVPPGNAPALADALAAALLATWDSAEIQRSVEQLTWQALAARNCQFLESVAGGAAKFIGVKRQI